jgi:hypothetical protein
MFKWKPITGGLVIVAVVFASSAASAAYTAVDTFEAYSVGSNIIGQGGWNTGAQANFFATVEVDPASAGNKVLQVMNSGGQGRVFNDFQASRSGLNIAMGTTGTLFSRFRTTNGGVDVAFGSSDIADAQLLTDSTAGGRFDNFEAYGRVQNNGLEYQVRDGGGFTTGSPLSIMNDTWYNLWLVINNSANTYRAYVQGPSDANPVQYLGGNATGDFAMRTTGAPHGNLISYLIDSNATSPNTYFDDIYIDTAGENLTNPVTGIVIIPGDVDGDGDVDLVETDMDMISDFDAIRDHFQSSVTARSMGDLTFDNFVDFADFRQWKTAFLGGGGSLEGVDLSFISGGVPEPSCVCLAFFAICGWCLTGRHPR